MKKGKRDEVLKKTRVEFDESICLTDDQLEVAEVLLWAGV